MVTFRKLLSRKPTALSTVVETIFKEILDFSKRFSKGPFSKKFSKVNIGGLSGNIGKISHY